MLQESMVSSCVVNVVLEIHKGLDDVGPLSKQLAENASKWESSRSQPESWLWKE